MTSAAGGTAMHAMSASGPQAVTAPPAAGSGEHDPGMPGGPHDILHRCLAVLCAAGALPSPSSWGFHGAAEAS